MLSREISWQAGLVGDVDLAGSVEMREAIKQFRGVLAQDWRTAWGFGFRIQLFEVLPDSVVHRILDSLALRMIVRATSTKCCTSCGVSDSSTCVHRTLVDTIWQMLYTQLLFILYGRCCKHCSIIRFKTPDTADPAVTHLRGDLSLQDLHCWHDTQVIAHPFALTTAMSTWWIVVNWVTD